MMASGIILPIISTDPLYIGCVHGLNRLDGAIDEVSVWDFARTAAQIQNNLLFPISGTDSGLVAYYNFNDNNRSGQNRIINNLCVATGAVLNGVTAGTALTPIFDCAPPPFTNPECNYVASTFLDYISIPHQAALSLSDFTVAAYIKTTDNSGLYKAIIAKASPGGQANYVLYKTDNNKAQITFTPNPYFGGGVNVRTTSNINDGLWHYVVGTRSATELKIYFDGVLEGTYANTYLPQVSTLPLQIGANNGSNKWSGSLDEISVWNTALSQAQISSLIGQQLLGNESNLVAYYNFDNVENSGQNVVVNNLCSATGSAIDGLSIGTATTPVFTCSKIPIVPVSNCNLLMNGFNNAVTSTGANASYPYTNITQNFTMEVLAKPLLSKGWASSGPIPIWPPGHYIENGTASGQRYVIGPDQGAGYAPGHAGVGMSLGTNGVAVYEHSTNYMPGRINLNNYPVDDWVHLTVVCSNGALKLYVNGVPAGSASASGYILHPSIALGHNYGYYGGYVGEVRVWNTPLSSAQIRSNINVNLVGNEANLVSLYKFGNNDTNGTNHIIPGFGSAANTITYKTAGTCSTPIFSCATDSTVTHDTLPGSGKMLAFNGVGSFAELGNLGAMPTQGSLLTWFNATTLKNNAMVFSTTHFRNQKGRYKGINLFLRSNGNLVMTIGVDSTVASGYQDTYVIATNIKASKWYHFALTWNRSTNQFTAYINGIPTITSNTGNWPSKFESFKAGIGIAPEANYAWHGYIDELSEWNKILSQTEIRQQMCSKINTTQANYTNVLHNYRFDNNDCGGDAIHDYAGNAHGVNFNWYWYSYYNSVTFQVESFKIYTHDAPPTSSAPIGSYSSYDYSGSTSQQNLTIDNEDSVHAKLVTGTADGIHVYGENTWPNTINGIFDTVAGSNHYAGVWVVNPDTSAQYTLDYTYTNNPNVTPLVEPYLLLYKRNHNADAPWVGLTGASLDTMANLFTAMGQHTEFILGKTAIPLAINELSFSIAKENANAILNWNVTSNDNVHNFDVMRSTNGVAFKSIAKVAKTNTTSYNYTDANLLSGKYYYKIKLNDINTKSTYSETRKLEMSNIAAVHVYPNPATTELTIATSSPQFEYTIHNSMGQIIYQGNSKASVQTINIQSLSNGIYTMAIKVGLTNQVVKFTKQ
jgi:Concanavalin A-like lectin/glucanases superfamily/Secretion system C-terminal sorting domain